MRAALTVTGLALAACMLGCEAGTDVSGTWKLRDTHGYQATLTMSQIGTTVTGRLEGYGYSVPLSGTCIGNTLRIGVQGEGHDIRLTATVSGDSMQGTVSDAATGRVTSFTGTRTGGKASYLY
ncbi:MAG: hypothetical protein FJ225_09420 [Lentisphaerae bacterium]|nr:hypothetical protein [Lentisphaerota bacterium]